MTPPFNDPEPVNGPRMKNERIDARAMIEWAEGERSRDTTRARRRTRPEEQAYTYAYYRALLAGDRPSSTPAEDGFDRHA